MDFYKYCLIFFISFSACSQDRIPELQITAQELLEVHALNASSVQLNWINSKPEEQDAQLLERKKLGDTDFMQVESIEPGTETHLDDSLAAETGYVYRIRAEKAGTYSNFSNEAEVTTYPRVADGEFLVLDTLFKGGSTGSKTNPSRFLAYADHTAELGKYGGWTAVQLEATGKFRTEKYNGTWYLVDPEGYLFFGTACNSIKAENEYNSITLPDDLLDVGFNHLGNWSNHEAINSGSKKIPYTFRELFLSGYKNTSQRTKDLYSKGIIAVFDSEFTAFADDLAQVVAQKKDDPYCIGVFSDNELPIYTNETYGELLDRYLTISDKTDPNYKAADAWMVARKGVGYTPDEQDRLDWHGKLMSTYYQIVNTAIKKYGPDMLYLGSRLHGGAKTKNSIFRDSAPYIDVFSVNYYGNYDPHEEFEMWVSESNKPFLISEFYGKGFDVNLDNSTGAGYHVPTQQDRAMYFENIVIRFLESEGCVGYQWHKFQDDNSNRGIIDTNENWYEELRQSLIKINKDIYKFRIYLRSN